MESNMGDKIGVRDRYYVDERAGCVAVRDRTLDSEYEPGLHPETTGVIKFWMGTYDQNKKCGCCNSTVGGEWSISKESVEEAKALCKKLNSKS